MKLNVCILTSGPRSAALLSSLPLVACFVLAAYANLRDQTGFPKACFSHNWVTAEKGFQALLYRVNANPMGLYV